MLEVAVGVEVETDEVCDDLGVRHHTLAYACDGVFGYQALIEQRFLPSLHQILCRNHRQYKNFSNFTLGDHDL